MASLSFKDKLFATYPIPRSVSIWEGDGVSSFAVSSLDDLISSCVDELRSDLYITEYVHCSSQSTSLPEDAFAVVNAKIDFQFQGNRSVRVDFDAASHRALIRYVPAVLTYRRYLRLSDLDTLAGDRLIYAKMYVLWQMAEKELTILRSVVLDADNGTVNLDALASFSDKCRDRYEEMKAEVFIYTSGV